MSWFEVSVLIYFKDTNPKVLDVKNGQILSCSSSYSFI